MAENTGTKILVKRAKNYLSNNVPIADIKDIVLYFGELLFLEDVMYLVLGDGESTVEELITKKQYLSGPSVTVLTSQAVYDETLPTYYSESSNTTGTWNEHKHDIANLEYVKNMIMILVNGFSNGGATKSKTITSVNWINQTPTPKFDVVFEDISITASQVSNFTSSTNNIIDSKLKESYGSPSKTVTSFKKDANAVWTPSWSDINIGMNQVNSLVGLSLSQQGTQATTMMGLKIDKVNNVYKLVPSFTDIKITADKVTDLDSHTITNASHATNADNATTATTATNAINVNISNGIANSNYYILGVNSTENKNLPLYRAYNTSTTAVNKTGVRFNGSTGVLYGAAWNDYAEYRKCKETPGTVVCEKGNGELEKSSQHLQKGAAVVSDTYGIVIGIEDDDTEPIAVSGRVLVKYNGEVSNFQAGDAVCAGANGGIDVMNRDEIKEYPERILGIVSEIPQYDVWNDMVSTTGRIWIKVR